MSDESWKFFGFTPNVDQSSARYCGIQLRVISQEMLKISVLDRSLKITDLIQANFPGANEFIFQLPILISRGHGGTW